MLTLVDTGSLSWLLIRSLSSWNLHLLAGYTAVLLEPTLLLQLHTSELVIDGCWLTLVERWLEPVIDNNG